MRRTRPVQGGRCLSPAGSVRKRFPRTAPLKSYSRPHAASSAASILTFFILLLFASRCRASADDASPVRPIRMDHDKEPLGERHSHGNETTLVGRVVGVSDGRGKRISEDGRGLLERDAVIQEV